MDRTFDSTFFVLDFDRTLANTDALHEALERVITEETGISTDFLRTARVEAEATGQSFDTIDYLRRYLAEADADDTWPRIQRAFITAAQKKNMLEPYARELLALLDRNRLPYGVITYGGEAWQLAKIEASGLMGVPHIVTHIQKKGEILSGWKKPGGEFIVPPALTRDFTPLTVRTIVFIDDKPVSFIGMPEGVLGIHAWPIESRATGQADTPLEEGVRTVRGLEGAINLLFPK